jgi:hypothetical protein
MLLKSGALLLLGALAAEATAQADTIVAVWLPLRHLLLQFPKQQRSRSLWRVC